ncbi:MAG: hypothetical protein H8K03_14600 [Nitrospira sp.]|nr:hypothetical protein [Nitrospira sp. BO4]
MPHNIKLTNGLHPTTVGYLLPFRRNHIPQKVRIAGQGTLYISVHDDPSPAEIFLRVKGTDSTPELIGPYDVIARLMSIAL